MFTKKHPHIRNIRYNIWKLADMRICGSVLCLNSNIRKTSAFFGQTSALLMIFIIKYIGTTLPFRNDYSKCEIPTTLLIFTRKIVRQAILSRFCNFSDILESLEQKPQKKLNLLKTDKICENCKVYLFGFNPRVKW